MRHRSPRNSDYYYEIDSSSNSLVGSSCKGDHILRMVCETVSDIFTKKKVKRP